MKNSSRKLTLLLPVAVAMLFAGCATPLMNAAEKGDMKKMERLIAAGADVNERSAVLNGYSPINFAVYNGKFEAVRFLDQSPQLIASGERRAVFLR